MRFSVGFPRTHTLPISNGKFKYANQKLHSRPYSGLVGVGLGAYSSLGSRSYPLITTSLRLAKTYPR
jgi:hypothetical protein